MLTLRGAMTPATRVKYAEALAGGGARAASTREDAWQRAVELLFERLAVRWEIAGAPISHQRELLERFRVASPAERAWVREAGALIAGAFARRGLSRRTRHREKREARDRPLLLPSLPRGAPWRGARYRASDMRRTKIVATIGPASREPDTLLRMVNAGMDVARLNYSHGTLKEHAETVRRVRDAAGRAGRPVAILQDLPGPKLRIGPLREDVVELKPGDVVTFTCGGGTARSEGDAEHMTISWPGLADALSKGT